MSDRSVHQNEGERARGEIFCYLRIDIRDVRAAHFGDRRKEQVDFPPAEQNRIVFRAIFLFVER